MDDSGVVTEFNFEGTVDLGLAYDPVSLRNGNDVALVGCRPIRSPGAPFDHYLSFPVDTVYGPSFFSLAVNPLSDVRTLLSTVVADGKQIAIRVVVEPLRTGGAYVEIRNEDGRLRFAGETFLPLTEHIPNAAISARQTGDSVGRSCNECRCVDFSTVDFVSSAQGEGLVVLPGETQPFFGGTVTLLKSESVQNSSCTDQTHRLSWFFVAPEA